MPNAVAESVRERALERFVSTRAGREKPGRYWKVDLETIAPDPADCRAGLGSVEIESNGARTIACDLFSARAHHPELFERAFGATGVQETKFGALATAFAGLGAFVYVPADVACDDPIVVTYTIPDGVCAFPYTVVLAERGARVTIIERMTGGSNAFVCAAGEIVAQERATVVFAAAQTLADDARLVTTRAAKPGRDASVSWATAELGAAFSAGELDVEMEAPGAEAGITTLFFPNGAQHVDVVSTVDHRVGETRSNTMVKSAATGSGQARYLGNIRIAAHAQGSDASLRDDALLLSRKAHIDSIPALEIAANDVKAYHGATVGAIDQNQIFYMESRGIARIEAERMIALGFFEPAIARFPSEALRAQIRSELEKKLA